MMIPFIKLTEEDTRLIIALFIIVLLVFVFLGYIGTAIRKLMKWQAKDVDAGMSTLVTTGVVDTPKYFRKIALKKSNRLLYKQTRIALLLLALSIGFMAFYMNWTGIDNLRFLFDHETKGFTTLFFIFDWPSQPHAEFFGLTLPTDWPPLLNTPHFSLEAWPSYVFAPIFAAGAVWFLLGVQAYIARTWRIIVMSKAVFHRNLENVVPGSDFHPEPTKRNP